VHSGSGAGATMAPEGKDNIKGEACLGCKRNSSCAKTYGSVVHTIFQILGGSRIC
jgi:hypothetical protein